MEEKWNGKQIWREIKGRKNSWLILLLVGVLLVVIALPTSERKEEGTKEEGEERLALEGQWQEDSYEQQLETRLEQTLAKVRGVGKNSVMITLSSSAENVVEKDREMTSESIKERESTDTSKRSTSSETSVYTGGTGEETPYVSKQLSPKIEGVLVVAEGGDDPVVVENITEAVQALFGVDTHKIKVMKSN
ncbi:stage III sporulation protein AG [Roseburia hominis]